MKSGILAAEWLQEDYAKLEQDMKAANEEARDTLYWLGR